MGTYTVVDFPRLVHQQISGEVVGLSSSSSNAGTNCIQSNIAPRY